MLTSWTEPLAVPNFSRVTPTAKNINNLRDHETNMFVVLL